MKYLCIPAFIYSVDRLFFLLISFLFLLLLSMPTTALTSSKDYCWLEPYLGVDAGLRRMAWKQGYGDNVYKHTAGQSNIYAGLKFNPYFGIELGYEDLISKKRDAVIAAAGQDIIVLNTSFQDIISLNSKVKLSGWHVNVVGICPLKYWDCVELLGTVGIASLKTTQQMNIVGDNTGLVNPPLTVTFSKKKIVPRVSAGFQYNIADNCKLRFILIGMENTSFDLGPSLELPNDTFRTKMKHSAYHSVGVIFNF